MRIEVPLASWVRESAVPGSNATPLPVGGFPYHPLRNLPYPAGQTLSCFGPTTPQLSALYSTALGAGNVMSD